MTRDSLPVDQARRSFLRGRPNSAPPIRPPWTTEARVASRCLRCDACVTACPEKVIAKGEGSFPEIAIRKPGAACTFCGACAAACPVDVFDTTLSPPWLVLAAISAEDCLAHAGVHCESCRDACPEAAIAFRPRLGGPPLPEIAAARCSGCGACLGSCPGAAIALKTGVPAEGAA